MPDPTPDIPLDPEGVEAAAELLWDLDELEAVHHRWPPHTTSPFDVLTDDGRERYRAVARAVLAHRAANLPQDPRVDAIRARAYAATPEPWVAARDSTATNEIACDHADSMTRVR